MVRYALKLVLLAALFCGLAPAQRVLPFRRAPEAGASVPLATSRWEGNVSGSTVADTVGANNCTTVNTPTDTAAGIDFEADQDEYMHCGNMGSGYDADLTAISFCGVINIESFVDAPIASVEWTSFPKGWSIRTTAGGDIHFRIFEITNGMRIETATPLSVATVYHLCATAPTNPTAATAAIYVNGVAVADTVVEDDLGAADADVNVTFRVASTHTDSTNTADIEWTVGTYWHGTELTPAHVSAQCIVDQDFAATQGVTVTCD